MERPAGREGSVVGAGLGNSADRFPLARKRHNLGSRGIVILYQREVVIENVHQD